MLNFCIPPKQVLALKKALKNGELDPTKLAEMTSKERRVLFQKSVSEGLAKRINSEFETKLLLKNQQAGFINWAKSVTGIKPNIRRDLVQQIRNMKEILTPEKQKLFMEDLVARRMGYDVTIKEAETIARLSDSAQASEIKWQSKLDANTAWSENPNATRKEWYKNSDRLRYGLDIVNLKNFTDDLKLEANKIKFREEPIRKLLTMPVETFSFLKSVLASLDNSFFGRQGIKQLVDPRRTKIWVRNFSKSWGDIGKQLFAKGKWYKSGDDALNDLIRADILSRPNALNGKYAAGGYGLNVLGEEAFPSSLPSKIPLFGRLFKASEVAYNGAALRMRADLADQLIYAADKFGVNTLNKQEARGIGNIVSAATGRGEVPFLNAEGQRAANALFFSIKFVKANIDTVTAHIFDKSVRSNKFARREAARNLAHMVITYGAILGTYSALNPDAIDLDPRSQNFGKIKLFGIWTDITGGMASLVTLGARLVPTEHEGVWGLWKKSSSGKWVNLTAGEYGQQDGMDLFNGFVQGKLSPGAGIFRDILKGRDYSGQPVTPTSIATGVRPIIIDSYRNLTNNPNASFVLGSIILEGLGFSISTYPEPNTKTDYIPTGKAIENKDFISAVQVYAQAFGVDPETAFSRIFTGQTIRKVENGAVIVERMSVGDSQDVKEKANADNPQMKLDHTIPLQLGGGNDSSNLKVVTTSQHRSYTQVENALGRALKAGKISKSEAQDIIVKFKNGELKREDLLDKYK